MASALVKSLSIQLKERVIGLELFQWVVIALLLTVVGYVSYRLIYNLYFHPLSKFPGPWLAAVSPLLHSYHMLGGRAPFVYCNAHRKYGPILRIAPNELSFATLSAWKEIYTPHAASETFLKSENYYNQDPKTLGAINIITVRDPPRHADMKRTIAPAFSTKAMREQEPLIDSKVDLLIAKLGKRYAGSERGPDGEYCDLNYWLASTTFDTIGDLAFGSAEAFMNLSNERQHPWVMGTLHGLYAQSLNSVFGRFPVLRSYVLYKLLPHVTEVRNRVQQYSSDMVKRRMALKTDRKDFMAYILDKQESQSLTLQEMGMQMSVLILAGSETSSTTLSGILYHLLKTPLAYEKLTTEIRTTFTSYSTIKPSTLVSLPYLNAVVEEGLRIYPPVPGSQARTSPGAMVAGHYIPKGVDVGVHAYTITHDPAYFPNPDEFIPERWIDGQSNGMRNFREASQPFLLGPRGCLGKQLAYLEMRLILAKMVYVYDFELVEKNFDWVKGNRSWILWWKPPLHVKVRRREGLKDAEVPIEQ